jgi:putative SOS response-associated peptidase YedK
VPTDAETDPWLWTVTVLTTTATDDLGRIHDRMPLLVEKQRYAEWLDPAVDDPDELRGLLVPAAPGLLTAYPVATTVNNVKNNGPELVDPLPTEPELPRGGQPHDGPAQAELF